MAARASEELESLTIETQRRHPLIKVIADAASDMVRYAGEFGLTPVARTRLAQGLQQSPLHGKYDDAEFESFLNIATRRNRRSHAAHLRTLRRQL